MKIILRKKKYIYNSLLIYHPLKFIRNQLITIKKLKYKDNIVL